MLLNYQKVLMKPYGDAGLVSLAKESGYRAETLKSIKNATNFRRTHLFLLQCFEAHYKYFLFLFLSEVGEAREGRMKIIIDDLLHVFERVKDESSLEAFRLHASKVISL